VNFILGIPLEVRLGLVFVLGACAGAIVNWAVCTLAYSPRTINPWASPSLKPRHSLDFVPIVGWLGMAKATSIGQTWLWLRPLVVELSCAAALTWLYYWETKEFALLPPVLATPPLGFIGTPNIMLAVHVQFLAHSLLAMLMLAASLVDIDERNIPDGITVPGTLAGLILAAAYPWSILSPDAALPPAWPLGAAADPEIDFLKVTSPVPTAWPDALLPRPNFSSLAIGLGCYLLWCAALLPRPWRTRRGVKFAVRLLTARMVQGLLHRPSGRFFYPMLLVVLIGIAGITSVWAVGGASWVALISALIGMAAGGGIVWIVRQIGWFTLGREAMGFGDVTLMAMIGAFLGWQNAIVIFFAAPLLALAWAVAQWIRSGDDELFHGPFLCLAAAIVVVRWVSIWEWARGIFILGWFVPLLLALAFVLMALMLSALRRLRGSP
jgi:prepilin signal peptidase PulO-like enzyme (type II secretory pathway)